MSTGKILSSVSFIFILCVSLLLLGWGGSVNLQDEVMNAMIDVSGRKIKFKNIIENKRIISNQKYKYNPGDMKETLAVSFTIYGKNIEGIPVDEQIDTKLYGALSFVAFKDSPGRWASMECESLVVLDRDGDESSFESGCSSLIQELATSGKFNIANLKR